jgi:hypothetical protein
MMIVRSRVARRERVFRGEVMSDHLVQFFDTIESLAGETASFLLDGHAKGHTLLVVAKPRHWTAMATALSAREFSVSRALTDMRLHVLDAEAMLSGFMRDGMPDAGLFGATIGELVERLSARRVGLRIYGEMVEVLAEEGNFEAAHRLEELWNDLGARHSFVLMCGYSAAHFTAGGARAALSAICRSHTHVRRNAADLLAEWMLANEPAAAPSAVPSSS